MAIQPQGRNLGAQERMCQAAGGRAATRLVVEDWKPGAGSAMLAANDAHAAPRAVPVLQGRSSLGGSEARIEQVTVPVAAPASARSLSRPARAAAASQADTRCPASDEAFEVPIMADATLRRGDLVATVDGMKKFVGHGSPPYSIDDFRDATTPEITGGRPIARSSSRPRDHRRGRVAEVRPSEAPAD
jgi:hypothetical protein